MGMRPGMMLQLIAEFRCTLAWLPNFAFQFLARRVRAEDRGNYDLSSLRGLVNCSEPIRCKVSMSFYPHTKLMDYRRTWSGLPMPWPRMFLP